MDVRGSLEGFLRAKAVDLRNRINEARDDLARYERDLDRLIKAAEAADVDLDDLDIDVGRGLDPPAAAAPETTAERTMKEAAVEILTGSTGGLTANEILSIMHDKYGMKYPRSSLSPQLSRLKGDGVIARHEGRWILPDYMPGKARNENETPQGVSETETPAFQRRRLLLGD